MNNHMLFFLISAQIYGDKSEESDLEAVCCKDVWEAVKRLFALGTFSQAQEVAKGDRSSFQNSATA